MFDYPVTLTPDGGTVLVTFVDVPEAITFGVDEEEALLNAIDALETGLSFYVEACKPLPAASQPAPGQKTVRPSADVLGLDMETVQPSGLKNALEVAARSISTSYRDVMTPDMLLRILRSGHAPEQFQPHLMALLDETPLPVVVKAVAEAATPEVPAEKIMEHLSAWAKQWKVRRAVL